jgi:hypothetical protein
VRHDPFYQASDGRSPRSLHSGLPYPVWEPRLSLHGVDHDLVLLPPSVPVDPASPSGSDERVGDLDPIGLEKEHVLSSPDESPDSPTDIDPIIKSMAGLCLHANEAQASGGTQPHGFDYPRLER